MLQAIRRREINLVMASELSRISRSMKDFSEIWELMKAHGCGFQSLRENFDTTAAAGEMVLYTIASFAQFERRQCSERVAANFNARAKRGLYNGGPVPLGYTRDLTNKGMLLIDSEYSSTIDTAFEIFLKEETLSHAAKELNRLGYKLKRKMEGGGSKARLDFFTVDNLHRILRNKAYIGIRTYRDANGKIVEAKGSWEPIVDLNTFSRVQRLLSKNKSAKKPHSEKRYPYLLAGLTYCEKCKNVWTAGV